MQIDHSFTSFNQANEGPVYRSCSPAAKKSFFESISSFFSSFSCYFLAEQKENNLLNINQPLKSSQLLPYLEHIRKESNGKFNFCREGLVIDPSRLNNSEELVESAWLLDQENVELIALPFIHKANFIGFNSSFLIDHMTVLIVDKRYMEAYYYDPKGISAKKALFSFSSGESSTVLELLQKLSLRFFGIESCCDSLYCHQTDSSNCGVFVAKCLQAMALQQLSFDQFVSTFEGSQERLAETRKLILEAYTNAPKEQDVLTEQIQHGADHLTGSILFSMTEIQLQPGSES